MIFREWVREWLGIGILNHNIQNVHLQIEARLKQDEHIAGERHEALMGVLNRIEQRLINAHAFDKPNYSPAQLDWDTVQAIALQQLQSNPEKEN
jgi:hypothetical protein